MWTATERRYIWKEEGSSKIKKEYRTEKVGLRTREPSIMHGSPQRCVSKINSIENGRTEKEREREKKEKDHARVDEAIS